MHAVPIDKKLLRLGEWKGVCENQPILTEPDPMIVSQEPAVLSAQTRLEKIRRHVEQAADSGERIDRVERELFAPLLELGLMLLRASVDGQADGDSGARVAIDSVNLRRLISLRKRRYLPVFGELAIMRRVYGTRDVQKFEGVPLDARLGLPEGRVFVRADGLATAAVRQRVVPRGRHGSTGASEPRAERPSRRADESA